MNDIFQTALRQSAVDLNCTPEDFLRAENLVVPSASLPGARRYLSLPLDCELVSYGGNVVASVRPELTESVKAYLDGGPPYRCFETPQLYELNTILRPHGLQVAYMGEYFLPDHPITLPCPFETRILQPPDFDGLYRPEWSNALCEKRKELDVLGIGAYDGETLIGLAACSADCDEMWQIGIDVLPAYRKRGIASALVSQLTGEILHRGKVPFYCAAWSNIPSVRNALRSGFRPAWVELTVKPTQNK